MSDKKIMIKNGVTASCVAVANVPKGVLTVLDYLSARFEHIVPERWQTRLEQGDVVDANGKKVLQAALIADFVGQKLFYYRHVDNEAPIPFTAELVYEDENIVVADKPHFLPVMPGGHYLQQTLLVRLRQQLDCPELTPVHRIDRETAGLVLLVKKAALRGVYQALFRDRLVEKHYVALAKWQPEYAYPFEHASRLAENGDFFRMAEVAGDTNAVTVLDVLEHNECWARYVLKPITGKRHQLRVHMAALGMPIVNDGFYPQAQAMAEADYSKPLQLLAQKMAFVDPISGLRREFVSKLSLLDVNQMDFS